MSWRRRYRARLKRFLRGRRRRGKRFVRRRLSIMAGTHSFAFVAGARAMLPVAYEAGRRGRYGVPR